MAASHVFSTGILRVGAPGNTALGSPDVVGEAQDVSFECTFSRHEVFGPASVSTFAVEPGQDHEGHCILKGTVKDIARILLPYLAGATKASSGGVDTYTIGATSKPLNCRVEFDGVDTNGKNVKIRGTLCKGKGLTIQTKLTDYADLPVEFDFYPDPAATPTANTVCTVGIDQ